MQRKVQKRGKESYRRDQERVIPICSGTGDLSALVVMAKRTLSIAQLSIAV